MPTLAALLADAPVLMEGAMGTMLIDALKPGTLGEQLNCDHPEAVAAVHRAYAAVGARIHFTNTFSANRIRLERAGLRDRVAELNRAAVEIARAAVPPEHLVAGCVGPSGELLAPFGTLEKPAAQAAFAQQAAVLAAAGVDVLWVETMLSLDEAEAAVAGCREVASQPIVVTMAFSRTPRGYFTMMGHGVAECVDRLTAAGVCALGANCQLSPADIVPLAEELRTTAALPVVAQPNAGSPELGAAGVCYGVSPADYATAAARMAAAGVELIGGCCGTTPDHSAAARAFLDSARVRTVPR